MSTSFAFLSGETFNGGVQHKSADAQNYPFGIAGVAWDGSVTNRSGARLGPRAIREASQMLCNDQHPYFNTRLNDHCSDHGDLLLPNTSLTAMRKSLEKAAVPLIRGQHMVWLGGDHSITLSLLRAYYRVYNRSMAVIHFDAHCDTWTDHFGEPSGHGTWVYEAFKEKLVIPECFVQVGLRSSGPKAARTFVADHGGLIFNARDLRGLENNQQLKPIIAAVKRRQKLHDHPPVYLSFDIDSIDPAFAPGTGTPEPAGLTSNQAMTLLESWSDLNWIGMDCVEVSPPYDHAQLTSYLAAQLVWTYLCGQIAQL